MTLNLSTILKFKVCLPYYMRARRQVAMGRPSISAAAAVAAASMGCGARLFLRAPVFFGGGCGSHAAGAAAMWGTQALGPLAKSQGLGPWATRDPDPGLPGRAYTWPRAWEPGSLGARAASGRAYTIPRPR